MKPKSGEKLFYTIGEVSRLLKLKPYVLRFWESEFEVLKPEKNKNGKRIYKNRDIETLKSIKALLYEKKFTIAGARKFLSKDHGSEMVDSKYVQGELKDILNILIN